MTIKQLKSNIKNFGIDGSEQRIVNEVEYRARVTKESRGTGWSDRRHPARSRSILRLTCVGEQRRQTRILNRLVSIATTNRSFEQVPWTKTTSSSDALTTGPRSAPASTAGQPFWSRKLISRAYGSQTSFTRSAATTPRPSPSPASARKRNGVDDAGRPVEADR